MEPWQPVEAAHAGVEANRPQVAAVLGWRSNKPSRMPLDGFKTGGLSATGRRWGRPEDPTVNLAEALSTCVLLLFFDIRFSRLFCQIQIHHS